MKSREGQIREVKRVGKRSEESREVEGREMEPREVKSTAVKMVEKWSAETAEVKGIDM